MFSSTSRSHKRTSQKTVCVLQTVVPDYRIPVFSAMESRWDERFTLMAGVEYFSDGLEFEGPDENWFCTLNNSFLFRKKICWQSGAFGGCSSVSTLIAEANPRVLSTWWILILRKLLRRPTVLWGHSWSTSGKGSKSNVFRLAMFRLSDAVVCYSHTQKNELSERMGASFNARIHAAPNAVFIRDECRTVRNERHPTDIIYVGRLINAKKPMLLLEAYVQALSSLPDNCRLLFVGAGDQSSALKTRVSELGLSERVIFYGHVGEQRMLRDIYSNALFSVSPGYVGLSAIQSFAFGVPMLVADKENHSPEIEACIDGRTARFFSANSVGDLGQQMVAFFDSRETWLEKDSDISEFIAENYSVEGMVETFDEVVSSLV